MERLEKNAYQEKLVRGLLNSLRENKTISDVHVKNLISEIHSKVGRSLDRALIKKKADELLFIWMKGELNIVKKESIGKRTPLVIELKNEEDMNDMEFEIFTEKILEKVLVKESRRVRKEPEIKEEPKEIITPSKKGSKEERIRINTLDNIMEALYYYIMYNKDGGVIGNNVAKVLGVKKMSQIQIKTWVNGLSKHSVTLNVYYDGRNDKLVFREAEKDLSICCELYRKITGKEPKREYLKLLSGVEKPKVLVSKTSSAIIIKESVVDKKMIKEDSYEDLYYYAAGIIVEHSYKAVDIDSMCTNLRKLGYDVSKTDLQGILRKRAEFSVVRYGAAVGLNEGGWRTWDEIKEKFNPRNNIKWVDCRLSLAPEEVKNVFPETEVLSMITERDGFYRVYYNGSLTELTKWIQLATISIGAENLSKHIFDQNLVGRIKTRINLLNEFMLKEELGCKLETL
jgi:hypothetical protein